MALSLSAANDKMETCSCCYGELRVLYQQSKEKLVWRLASTLVTDVMWLPSDWCYTEKSECRLFTTLKDEAIYLALMSRNRSDFGYTIRMGLLVGDSKEMYTISGTLPPQYFFQKARLCSLPDFNREIVRGQVQFFCEINTESIPESVEEKTVSKGTSTVDIERNSEGQSHKSVGARPKDRNTKPKELDRGQTIEAAGSARSNGWYPERNKRVEETGHFQQEREKVETSGTVYGAYANGGRRHVTDMRKLSKKRLNANLVFILRDGTCPVHEEIVDVRLSEEVMKDIRHGKINFEDISMESFLPYVDSLYTLTTDAITPDNVFEVLVIAERLRDNRVIHDCKEKMTINLNNFVKALEWLLNYRSAELKEAVFKFFVKNEDKIPQSRGFEAFYRNHPGIICDLFLRRIKECSKPSHSEFSSVTM